MILILFISLSFPLICGCEYQYAKRRSSAIKFFHKIFKQLIFSDLCLKFILS